MNIPQVKWFVLQYPNDYFHLFRLHSVCQRLRRPRFSLRSSHTKNSKKKKWYFVPPCLTLSIIKYGSRVKWSNPGKGVAPFPTPWCSSYRKGSLWVTLDYDWLLFNHYNIHKVNLLIKYLTEFSERLSVQYSGSIHMPYISSAHSTAHNTNQRIHWSKWCDMKRTKTQARKPKYEC